MKKHGLSHGAAVLVCTLSSALIVDVLRKHVPVVHEAVEKGAKYLLSIFEFSNPPEHVAILLYATLLAIIWGVAFALMHKD
jgi:hypothetical protein